MKTVARKISEVKQEIVSVRQEMELVRTQYTARLAQLEKELDVVSKKPAPVEYSQYDSDAAQQFGRPFGHR